jgi:hypothetical protein
MLPKLRPQLSGFVQNKSEHWKLPGLGVNHKLEAVREQRLHHQPHLIFGRIAVCCPRLNVK